MTERMRTRLKVWLVVMGVFALGCITGASLDGAYRLRVGGERREMRGSGRRSSGEVLEKMRRDLSLNDNQATEIGRILEQTHTEYRSLRAEVRPRYDRIRQSARTQIRSLLTPEQQKVFDAKAAERDARHKDDGR
ncbi:MAG: hypothetical protein H0V27_13200 [Pyrinomonadaceae bacterium]|nr:hypothetical protein [Pyrinomonadaceae bacterium]